MSVDCHRGDPRRRRRLVNDFDAEGTYQLAHHRHSRARDRLTILSSAGKDRVSEIA